MEASPEMSREREVMELESDNSPIVFVALDPCPRARALIVGAPRAQCIGRVDKRSLEEEEAQHFIVECSWGVRVTRIGGRIW